LILIINVGKNTAITIKPLSQVGLWFYTYKKKRL